MIIQTDRYVIASAFERGIEKGTIFPKWGALNWFYYVPGQKMGSGPEPHYHDCDEFWLFITGRGHLSIDGKEYPFTPGTVAYTPMGSIHEFHSHTDFETVGAATHPERKKRAMHIHVEEWGPPEPTVPGFVVDGAENNGPFKNRGTRCPLSELRVVNYGENDGVQEETLARNEYWILLSGVIGLSVDGIKVELSRSDTAILRKGTSRSIKAIQPAKLVLARE